MPVQSKICVNRLYACIDGDHQCSLYFLKSVCTQNFNMQHFTRAWPIHQQHSPSGPIVGQSEPSANDDNRRSVHADVSRWCYWIHLAMGSIDHPCRTIQSSARYLPLMTVQEVREVSICDEARPTTHAVLFKLWGGSLIKLFFYYLVGPTIIVPGLDWMW